MSASSIKEIFLEALDRSVSEREVWLRERCGEDLALLDSVRGLLQSHEKTSMLDQSVSGQRRMEQIVQAARVLESSNDPTAVDEFGYRGLNRSGEQIGKYRLMELLAEGGFGQVYVGQQSEPINRLVAVKLLKQGMDSREVVARFEAERQALAMMSHPNIAQVFDGGTTDKGQPFLVMELVRGQPITEFCRSKSSSIRDKLVLMIDVCQAVQHAHQKGIIHRDLKPSNVLVALDDTKPVVKVIDFGIAKAIGQALTDKTIYTRFTQIIGTPMYMSPEQAEMKAQDVDTLTDVYALGVLLYELLTEQTPFDRQRIQSASFDEMRRIIREDRPPKPSQRVTSFIGDQSTKANRSHSGIKHRDLVNQLRGDLDWVVLKAMDKDRRRRYETPADFARDLTNYLEGQPVAARAPSTVYRVTRFAQRNKWAVIATGLVLLSLIGGTGVSIWQALEANAARAEAEDLKQKALDSVARLKEANILIDSARANTDQQRWEEAMDQFTEAANLQPDHFLAWAGRGNLYARLGEWTEAAEDYAKAIHLGAPANHPAWWGVPELFLYAGDSAGYEKICQALRVQLETGSDELQNLFAIRGLCLGELDPVEARYLVARLETMNLNRLDWMRGNRRGGSGGPGGPAGGPGVMHGRRGPPPRGLNRDQEPGFGADDQMRPPRREQRDRPNDQDRLEGFSGRGGPPFRGDGPPGLAGPIRDSLEYVKALAYYRAGEYRNAITLLDPDDQLQNRKSVDAIRQAPLLALVYWELGEEEKSQQYLAKGIKHYHEWVKSERVDQPRNAWFDGLDAWILLDEAHRKTAGSSFPREIAE